VPYLAVAVIGLAFYAGGFTVQCRKSRLPGDLDVEQCRFPVRVESITVASPAQLRFVVEGWRVGDVITLTDAADVTRTAVLVPAAGPGVLVVTAVSGVFFWSVCLVVFVPRTREPAVPLFFWILLLYGLAVMVGGVFFAREPISVVSFFGLLQVASLALLPPIFLLLTLRFPRRQPVLDRCPWLMPVLWAAAAGLVIWQAWAYGRYFAEPGPARVASYVASDHAADIFMLVVVAFGFASLVRQIRVSEIPREVKQIRWLLWGFAVGAAPYLALRTLPQLVGLPAPLPAGADRVLEMAVPLAFVCAVVSEQLLDIDVIIRRSLLYSMMAVVVLALMLVPSLILTWSFGSLRPNAYRVALLCGGLAAGLLFNPLRHRLGGGIDRWVFKLRRDDQALLDELDRLLQLTLAPAEVGEVVEHAVGRWFACRPVALDFSAANGGSCGVLAARDATDSPDLEQEPFPAAWNRRGFVAAFAVTVGGNGYGWLLIGPRDSRRRYLRPDLDLGVVCARRVARVLDRLRLIREKTIEAEARRQLDELNRMKSEFLAQVAHDLRTPVTSVIWSNRNLLDGLAGEVTDAQREYLGSVGDAAGHLETLVANLLELSQLERASLTLELSDFDPAGCLDRAASTIRPLAAAAGVTLAVQTEGVPPIHAHPDKLVEILVNILDNAVKYSPPGGVVRLAAADDGRGWCLITIADSGPGLDGTEDPFECFAQGAPSPHSSRKGFGLGLHIVRQYVNLMHGQVNGGNGNDGGARFKLHLPLARREA
jgi:signal transduction histidine kinase